jgi:hypothetical protein
MLLGMKTFDQLSETQKAQSRTYRPSWGDDRLRKYGFIIRVDRSVSPSLMPLDEQSLNDLVGNEERSKGDLKDYVTANFHLIQE